jgi:uncharacterized protein YjiS (DUF1127 family)
VDSGKRTLALPSARSIVMSTLQHRLAATRPRRPEYAADPQPAPRRLLILLSVLREWRRRFRGRETLAQLSDGALRDVGLTRADVARECGKPFWRE